VQDTAGIVDIDDISIVVIVKNIDEQQAAAAAADFDIGGAGIIDIDLVETDADKDTR